MPLGPDPLMMCPLLGLHAPKLEQPCRIQVSVTQGNALRTKICFDSGAANEAS